MQPAPNVSSVQRPWTADTISVWSTNVRQVNHAPLIREMTDIYPYEELSWLR